ncbi:MAG: CPBP family glutamic-type intramembrane protease [Thermoanaerobaculia bacterium]
MCTAVGRTRLLHAGLLATALGAWWISDHAITPWVQQIGGYERIRDRDMSVLLGHWVFGQLPRVLLCVGVWLLGTRLGLMPSLRRSLASGGSWRRVAVSGLRAAAVLLVLTVAVGAATGGRFGFHPCFTKMAGDLVSNMYEEIVYRGLMFCACYGMVAGASFPLGGRPHLAGVVAGTIGSSVVFAVGHEQYAVALRVVVGVVSTGFAYPWVAARSLWAPWITHMLVDVIGDSILTL